MRQEQIACEKAFVNCMKKSCFAEIKNQPVKKVKSHTKKG